MLKIEEQIQKGFIEYMQYHKHFKVFCNNNTGYSIGQRVKNKKMGTVSGASDIYILDFRATNCKLLPLFLEFKRPKISKSIKCGKPSDEQLEIQREFRNAGYTYEFVFSIDEAIKVFKTYFNVK